MTDILSRLVSPMWRGFAFPCSGREYGFRQEFARHRYVFKDDELIDSVGRENPGYTYTIPAREDLAKGPWRNWFTVAYPDFLAACLDRSTDTLVDPIHGEVEAKCASLRETLDVTKRDGVDVVAEFVYAPADAADADAPLAIESIAGAQDMAGFFDQEVEKVDWQQEPPPEPTLPLFDAIRGIGDQLEVAKGRFEAQMALLASQMERTNDRLDSLKNPDLQPLRRNARRLAVAAYKLHENATRPPSATKLINVTVEIGLIALSAAHSMTPQELQMMNPWIGRKTTVPANSKVRVRR